MKSVPASLLGYFVICAVILCTAAAAAAAPPNKELVTARKLIATHPRLQNWCWKWLQKLPTTTLTTVQATATNTIATISTIDEFSPRVHTVYPVTILTSYTTTPATTTSFEVTSTSVTIAMKRVGATAAAVRGPKPLPEPTAVVKYRDSLLYQACSEVFDVLAPTVTITDYSTTTKFRTYGSTAYTTTTITTDTTTSESISPVTVKAKPSTTYSTTTTSATPTTTIPAYALAARSLDSNNTGTFESYIKVDSSTGYLVYTDMSTVNDSLSNTASLFTQTTDVPQKGYFSLFSNLSLCLATETLRSKLRFIDCGDTPQEFFLTSDNFIGKYLQSLTINFFNMTESYNSTLGFNSTSTVGLSWQAGNNL